MHFAADDHLSKRTCGQVFVLPRGRLVRPAADVGFVKLFYSLQICVMHLEKNIFFCHHNFMKNSHSKLSRNEPENIS